MKIYLIMNMAFFKNWWLITVKGCLIAAFGALLLVNPYATVPVLVLLLGITIVAVGSLSVLLGFYTRKQNDHRSIWSFAEGVFEVLFGITVLFMPFINFAIFVFVSGIWLLVSGVFQVSFGLRHKDELRGWKFPIINGILALLIGFIFLFYPLDSILLFTIIGGITLLAFGTFLILTSIKMRNHYVQFAKAEY